jgi:hypothetical protein
VGKFSLVNQIQLQHRLLVTGVVLIVLAALSIIASPEAKVTAKGKCCD